MTSNMLSLRQYGPASTKNITYGTVGSTKRMGNIFTDEKAGLGDHNEGMTSRMFDMSQDGNVLGPEKVLSVAERSVLSQNFVHGTEDSEESIIGVAKKVKIKPLAYCEFKEAVKRQADTSTAPTHNEFMWEVSETWKSLRYANFKSIGLDSFKRAQEQN